MNNEEKILSLLEKMDARQTQSDQILAQLTSDMSAMKERMDKLNDRMGKLEITLENDVKPTQQLILETLVPVTEKIKEFDRIPPIEERVDVLEASVRHLANEVQRLKKAQ